MIQEPHEPAVVIARTLKRLYLHFPDDVLEREARIIARDLEAAGLLREQIGRGT